jgi:hypothetical protein
MVSRSTRLELVVVAAMAGPGCAARADARARAAFERSSPGAERDDSTDGGAGSGGGIYEPGTELPKQGWPRVADIVQRSADILEVSITADTLARLAQAWCAVEPEPMETEHGVVRICYPQPPVTIDGHAFSLELAAIGVIGLVAGDLSDAESRALTEQALAKMKSACRGPFQEELDRRDSRHELYTCPTPSGSLLAIGRLPVAGGVWQVSIAVIAAS